MKSLVCGTIGDSLISITFRLQSYAHFLKPPNFSPKICRIAVCHQSLACLAQKGKHPPAPVFFDLVEEHHP